jgi:hypothetical protein
MTPSQIFLVIDNTGRKIDLLDGPPSEVQLLDPDPISFRDDPPMFRSGLLYDPFEDFVDYQRMVGGKCNPCIPLRGKRTGRVGRTGGRTFGGGRRRRRG